MEVSVWILSSVPSKSRQEDDSVMFSHSSSRRNALISLWGMPHVYPISCHEMLALSWYRVSCSPEMEGFGPKTDTYRPLMTGRITDKASLMILLSVSLSLGESSSWRTGNRQLRLPGMMKGEVQIGCLQVFMIGIAVAIKPAPIRLFKARDILSSFLSVRFPGATTKWNRVSRSS